MFILSFFSRFVAVVCFFHSSSWFVGIADAILSIYQKRAMISDQLSTQIFFYNFRRFFLPSSLSFHQTKIIVVKFYTITLLWFDYKIIIFISFLRRSFSLSMILLLFLGRSIVSTFFSVSTYVQPFLCSISICQFVSTNKCNELLCAHLKLLQF